MLVSTAGECCFVGYAGENPTVYSCALPASLAFSVVLGGFPPLFVVVLLYHPFPLLSLFFSSPLFRSFHLVFTSSALFRFFTV